MRNLKLGDTVTARFLGDIFECEVMGFKDKDTFRLKTKQGAILPCVKWKSKCEVNKKGEIISPWYIEK